MKGVPVILPFLSVMGMKTKFSRIKFFIIQIEIVIPKIYISVENY